MKSLLVDVLRQAKDGNPEQTLSDSGSFDTTQSEFPATANDAVIEDGDTSSETLKLYETSESLDATFGSHDDTNSSGADEFMLDNSAGESTKERLKPPTQTPLPSVQNNGPGVARFAPLACIMLAALAAASWTGYQHLKLKYAESQFATGQIAHAGAFASGTESGEKPVAVERFPFLGDNAATSGTEGGE